MSDNSSSFEDAQGTGDKLAILPVVGHHDPHKRVDLAQAVQGADVGFVEDGLDEFNRHGWGWSGECPRRCLVKSNHPSVDIPG
jgi:hypothetical protein